MIVVVLVVLLITIDVISDDNDEDNDGEDGCDEAVHHSLQCLSSTTAFSFGAMFITRFEEETTGLQWDKMHDKVGDSVDFAWMCYMMLIDSVIYLILGWYVRNVKPGMCCFLW